MSVLNKMNVPGLDLGAFTTNQSHHSGFTPIDSNLLKSMDIKNIPSINPISGMKSFVARKPKPISNISNLSSGIDIAGNLLSPVLQTEKSGLTSGLDTGYDVASNAVAAIPGIGTAISAAMKVGGLASDALGKMGLKTDQITNADKVLDSKFFKLSPLGLLNAVGAKKSNSLIKDSDVMNSSGYSGTIGDINKASEKAGKKFGLFSRGKMKEANKNTALQSKNQSEISGILSESKSQQDRLGSIDSQIQKRMNKGLDYSLMQVGKTGMKMIKISDLKKSISKFENGGKLKNPNIVVDGALHARKHDLDIEGITSKGVPVIYEDGGKVHQSAEVEREEIVFNKDVTEQLEKLYKDGSEGSMIEAGKLLAHEILYNTIDNTGLIDKTE